MAQHPYGQPAGPGPYWQPQPPAPAPRSNVALIVVIVVLAVVLLLAGAGAALWFIRSKSATATTTQPATSAATSAATCAGGDTVTDPQYAYKAPPGWCVDENGLGLRTKTINVITVVKVLMTEQFEQTSLCDLTTGKLGHYTKLPSTTWGGRKAETYTVTSGIGEGPVWCLVDSRYQYMVSGTVGGWGTMDEVEAGVAQVIASWTWT